MIMVIVVVINDDDHVSGSPSTRITNIIVSSMTMMTTTFG